MHTRDRFFRESTRLTWLMLVIALALPVVIGCDSSTTEATGTNATVTSTSTASDVTPVPANGPPNTESTGALSQLSPPQNPKASPQNPKAIPTQSTLTVNSTFDDLKFDIEKTDHFDRSRLTPQIEKLFGKKIRIRGYIYPTLRKRGLKQFVLVRDNLECCFGPGAALYDCILIRMQPDKTAEYTIRPVAVEGVFRFEEFIGPDGKHLAIFCLDGEKVE
jgi:hypothetical protein